VTKVIWKIENVLNWTQSYLEKFCPNSPRLDAELLLSYVLECQRLDLYLRADQPLNHFELGEFRKLVKKRSNGCPIAYLTGEKEFWTLKLEVNNYALIPRPDTETLVKSVVYQITEWQKKNPGKTCQIFELGTGTAAIPISLCFELQNILIISVDCNLKILELAARNLNRYESLLYPRNNHVQLLKSNLFSNLNSDLKLDFIISNPPYIPSDDIDDLQVEISKFEPRVALDGGDDGLYFYRYLLKNGPSILKSNGEMFLEIGDSQEHKLMSLLKNYKAWKTSNLMRDLNGRNRVWRLKK